MASLASTTILPHRQPPLQNPDNNKDNLRLSQSRTLLIVLADTEERKEKENKEKENKLPEAPRKAEQHSQETATHFMHNGRQTTTL